jgi:hypothetical protein
MLEMIFKEKETDRCFERWMKSRVENDDECTGTLQPSMEICSILYHLACGFKIERP